MKGMANITRFFSGRDDSFTIQRKAVLLCVILLGLWGCKSSPDSYTFHNENVKGPVQKMVERTFSAVKDSAGWNTGRLIKKQILVFNSDGRLVERRVFGPDTSLIERFEYDYRQGHRQVERRYDSRGRMTHRKVFSYPWWPVIAGGVESRVVTPNDSLLWTATYQFNDEGREVQKSVYGPKGRLSLRVTFRYDRRGYLFQRIGAKERSYRFSNIDQYGNWQRRMNSRGGIKNSITLRTITYRKTSGMQD